MPLDKDEEVFEIVNSSNQVLGTRPRGQCHKEGIAHRAVYCLVFNKRGQLLLQQRSKKKKIGPEQWDLSLAEHLQPGETYVQIAVMQAVLRGLTEELGIEASLADIEGPLAPCHKRELYIPGVVHDVEHVECYKLSGWEGALRIDEDEVQAVRWIDIEKAYAELDGASHVHTPWLNAELTSLRALLLQDNSRPHRCVGTFSPACV